MSTSAAEFQQKMFSLQSIPLNPKLRRKAASFLVSMKHVSFPRRLSYTPINFYRIFKPFGAVRLPTRILSSFFCSSKRLPPVGEVEIEFLFFFGSFPRNSSPSEETFYSFVLQLKWIFNEVRFNPKLELILPSLRSRSFLCRADLCHISFIELPL